MHSLIELFGDIADLMALLGNKSGNSSPVSTNLLQQLRIIERNCGERISQTKQAFAIDLGIQARPRVITNKKTNGCRLFMNIYPNERSPPARDLDWQNERPLSFLKDFEHHCRLRVQYASWGTLL